MRYTFSLTVSESKRLIGKGVAALDIVRKALNNGVVAIAKGSANGYVVEEILGEAIEKNAYMTGATLPHGVSRAGLLSGDVADVVLRDGQRVEGVVATDYISEMRQGDVFMKGANALNYDKRKAGILIGHPTSGTIGAVWGTIVARKIHLVIPVGLEKSIPTDIEQCRAILGADVDDRGHSPSMFPVTGCIVTEVEAIKTLTGADTVPVGAGGLAGAEGAIWLCANGTPEQIDKVAALVESIHGEPPFVTP